MIEETALVVATEGEWAWLETSARVRVARALRAKAVEPASWPR